MSRIALALACLLFWSCAPEPPTGIVLKITTDLRQPRSADDKEQQINSLRIRVFTGDVAPTRPEDVLLLKAFDLGPGPGKFMLPSDLGLSRDGASEEALTIEVVASLGSRRVVSRTVKESFKTGRPKDVPVALNRECLGVACPMGLTCVPRFGCTEPTFPTPPAPFKGKDCACDSYFPICVGAFWAYDVFDANSVRSDKTWAFPFFGALNDTRHGLLGKKGYLQFRTAFTDFARRWVGVDGEPGQQTIWWLKDEWFDTNEKLTRLTYFNERKLRFDDSHQDPAAPVWHSDFTQFDYPSPDALVPSPVTYKDDWRVVTPDFVIRQPQSGPLSRFPIEFLSLAPLCHERRTSLPDGSQAVTKYFCFVKGIGKVYELTPNPREEEVLRKVPGSFNVPNCAAVP